MLLQKELYGIRDDPKPVDAKHGVVLEGIRDGIPPTFLGVRILVRDEQIGEAAEVCTSHIFVLPVPGLAHEPPIVEIRGFQTHLLCNAAVCASQERRLAANHGRGALQFSSIQPSPTSHKVNLDLIVDPKPQQHDRMFDDLVPDGFLAAAR